MSTLLPFNPLDKAQLGESVTRALLAQPPQALAQVPKFLGCGMYALYYSGPHPAYRAFAELPEGCEVPIYVGKAVPEGSRKGLAVVDASQSDALCARLREHARSIKVAANLDLDHFSCRFLVVDDIWIPLGESLLIARFSPVWNSVIEGFGNHAPGKGRHEGLRPRWDVLHPGRSWAAKCKERPPEETAEALTQEADTYLRQHLGF